MGQEGQSIAQALEQTSVQQTEMNGHKVDPGIVVMHRRPASPKAHAFKGFKGFKGAPIQQREIQGDSKMVTEEERRSSALAATAHALGRMSAKKTKAP